MTVLTKLISEREQWAARQKTAVHHQYLRYLECFATIILIAVVYMHYDMITSLTKTVMAEWLAKL